MSHSYVIWNCSPDVVAQLRTTLAGQAPVRVCESWEEVCSTVDGEANTAFVAGAPTMGVARPVNRIGSIGSAAESNDSIGTNGHTSHTPVAASATGDCVAVAGVANGQPATLAAQIDVVEKRIIEDTLRRNRNHRKETASDLGISRVTLYNKMKKFGLI